ncbi:MAG: hypothetical protein MAG715_00260 [Methanonatronarchaeales archaeon]|nr:hypothetical protein [Methanonatronarchaeales archaeon]
MEFSRLAKEKEERVTRALVELMERSGMGVERVSIDENNRGPDVVARGESGRVVVEVKALRRGGSLHSAIEQVRSYGEPGDELWVVTTSDEVPWFVPDGVRFVTGSEVLGKMELGGMDTDPVAWVRDTSIERDPPTFRATAPPPPRDSRGDGTGGFMSGGELQRAEGGDHSSISGDCLAARLLDALDEPLTVLDASKELGEEPALVESKLGFLVDVGAVERA